MSIPTIDRWLLFLAFCGVHPAPESRRSSLTYSGGTFIVFGGPPRNGPAVLVYCPVSAISAQKRAASPAFRWNNPTFQLDSHQQVPWLPCLMSDGSCAR